MEDLGSPPNEPMGIYVTRFVVDGREHLSRFDAMEYRSGNIQEARARHDVEFCRAMDVDIMGWAAALAA